MIPTISFVQTKFDEFNRLCFDGKLPPLTIKMSRARTFLGQLSYKRRIKLFGKVEKYGFVLKISTSFDLPEQEVEDTILHEMIHYHIGVNQLTDTSAHGQLFRKIMNDINTRFSRHVTISFKPNPEQRTLTLDSTSRLHVVAVAKLTDGRTGIKVLPLKRESILRFRSRVFFIPGVASVAFYLVNAPFFNRYPVSSVIKLHLVSPEDIAPHIDDNNRLQL